MRSSIWLENGKTNSMRAFGGTAIHSAICDHYRRRGWRVDTIRAFQSVQVLVHVPKRYWFFLGIYHWLVRLTVRRIGGKLSKDLGIELKVTARTK